MTPTRYVCMGCGGIVDNLPMQHRGRCFWPNVYLCELTRGMWKPLGHQSLDQRGTTLRREALEDDGCRRRGWR